MRDEASDACREAPVSAAFVSLADTLEDDGPAGVLDRLVGHTVALLAVDGAAIMLDPAEPEVVAASGEDAGLMALLQVQLADGPSMECLNTMAPISAPDLSCAQQRWPHFADAAAHFRRFRAVDALPLRLRLRCEAIGVLSLFRRSSGPLPAADLALAQALADVAAVGLHTGIAIRRGEVRNEQLQNALNSRVIIEQAKGTLACSAGLGVDAAFDRLRRHARHHNMRVVDVARQVVAGNLDLSIDPQLAAETTPRGDHR